MTYTEIYAVRPNGDITEYGEAHNAWGGAMHIWMKLGEQYGIKGAHPFDLGPLWKSINAMSERDQWVMASTFDQVIIPKEHLKTFVEHLQALLITEIGIIHQAIEDENVQGICFNQTSVNSNPWWICDESNEDEGKPYNVNQDTEHWFLTPEKLRET